MALYVGEGLERGKCHCLASGGLRGPFPVSSHFTNFLYATSAFLGIVLVVIPRVGGFAYILSLYGPFKRTLLSYWPYLLLPQPPLVFIARNYEALSSQYWNPGLHGLSWGWDRSLPRCPSWVLSSTHECGTTSSTSCHRLANTTLHPLQPHSLSLPLLPVWVNMASLNPWLLDFHTV